MAVEIRLGMSRYKGDGKTWLARVTGTDQKFGLARDFVNTVNRDMSKSGKTGTYVYLVEDGVYEGHEGDENTFYVVRGDTATEVDRDTALASLRPDGTLKQKRTAPITEGTLTPEQAVGFLGKRLRLTTQKTPDGFTVRVDSVFLWEGQPAIRVDSVERPTLSRVGLHVITSWQPETRP